MRKPTGIRARIERVYSEFERDLVMGGDVKAALRRYVEEVRASDPDHQIVDHFDRGCLDASFAPGGGLNLIFGYEEDSLL